MRQTSEDSSVQFMLAEYNRIHQNELQNRSLGGDRFNYYLTLLTFIGAALVAYRQLFTGNSTTELQEFLSVALGALVFVSLIGGMLLRLLLERWRLSIIYLRKLAKIRTWFLKNDINLTQQDLIYGVDDTKPSFYSKRFLASSLAQFALVLNTLTLSTSATLLVKLIYWMIVPSQLIITAITSFTVIYVLQRQLVVRAMKRMEIEETALPISTLNKEEKPR
jgi:hypothetical protein